MSDSAEAAPQSRKAKSWKTAILGAIGALLTALALLFFWDDRLDPAPDLQPRHPRLTSNADNGFIQLADRWLKYPEPRYADIDAALDMMSGGTAWDQTAADALDSAGIPFAGDLEESLAMRDWQLQSALPDGDRKSEAVLAFFRNTKLATFRVITDSRRGTAPEAFHLWELLLRAQQRSLHGSTCFLDADVSLAGLQLTAQSALHVASLPPDQLEEVMLASLQTALLNVRIAPEEDSEVLRHEAAWNIQVLRRFKRQGPDPMMVEFFPDKPENDKFSRFFLKPNRTMNRSLGALRRLEPSLMRQAPSREPVWMEAPHPETGPMRWLNPNWTGLILLRQADDLYQNLDEGCRSTLATARATAVCIAIRRWQRHHAGGGTPSDLHELIPAFLEAVPQDPFDGKPLRWNKTEGVVYSIGSDWTDNPPVFERPLRGKTRAAGRFSHTHKSPGVRLEVPQLP